MDSADSTTRSTWRRLAGGELSWETFRRRSMLLERTRAYFLRKGFLEVDPPIAVFSPNIDPNVFPVVLSDAAGRGTKMFLHTSPELSMKKLIAAGSGNIFYLGKVFRDREGSPLHHSEFTMLEWYRVGEPVDAIMEDVEAMGTARIGPGTLYAALARLEARGLIEALPPEDRRRPYRLTGLGATTLKAQLKGLAGFARIGLRRLEGSGSS